MTLVHELAGDEDRGLVVDDITDDVYEVARIIDAARTPPFLTARRVVVARHIEQFTRQDDVAPLIDYVTDPLETTALVLVAAGTVHKALVDAVKKHGGELVDTDPGRATKEWLKEQFNDAPVKLDQAARDLVAERLGEAIGRLPAILDGLESTYGPGALARRGRGRAVPRRRRRGSALGAHRRDRQRRHGRRARPADPHGRRR